LSEDRLKEILERLSVKPFSVVGHRGAAGEKPENTVEAFKYAIELGVDVVECDVRRTKDGKLVVIHDDNLKRIAGINVKVSDLTYSELRDVRIDGERIPLLEEVLNVVEGNCGLFIEIKEPETTELILKSVNSSVSKTSWIGFISFYEEALVRVKEWNKNLTTGLIYSKPPGKILDAKRIGCEFVLPKWYLSTEKAVNFAHRLGLRVVSWVIDDEKTLDKALKSKSDALATDFPSWLLNIRKELL
jgi:glycerophosphoryl diester phosphodiesterase